MDAAAELEDLLARLGAVCERVRTLELMVDQIAELSRHSASMPSNCAEAYYLEQINAWIGRAGAFSGSLVQREKALLAANERLLAALRALRREEARSEALQRKCDWYRARESTSDRVPH